MKTDYAQYPTQGINKDNCLFMFGMERYFGKLTRKKKYFTLTYTNLYIIRASYGFKTSGNLLKEKLFSATPCLPAPSTEPA